MNFTDLDNVASRLGSIALTSLGAAAESAVRRTNYKIEPEHWLLALLRTDGSDLQKIGRRFGVEIDKLDDQLSAAIDGFRRGDGSRRPDFSPQTVELLEQAWLSASMRFGETVIRGGHLLMGLTQRPTLWRILAEQCSELQKIRLSALEGDFKEIVGPAEEPPSAVPPLTAGTPSAMRPGEKTTGGLPASATTAGGKKSAFDRFTIDLTALAAAGKIDPVFGRDREIDQCIQALSRRKQNNPILVGDAGVGKTAIVEGLALLLAQEKIQSPLFKKAVIRSLDLGALQAGAGVRGEFEERLRSVIEECRQSSVPIILFIDEAHMLMGAGGSEGQGEAANLLKPALARGELRAIAATTWAEYKKYFEKDAALARRFDLVKVAEPDEETACHMLRGALATLEKHHNVRVLNEAVIAAVKLSKRYLPGRQLPDKAVSLLDTACTAVNLSTSVEPPAIQDCRRRLDDIAHALRLVRREKSAGHGGNGPTNAEANLLKTQSEVEKELADLDVRYQRERDLVIAQRAAWEQASDESLAAATRDSARANYAATSAEARSVQKDQPLVHAIVDKNAVADVVARWTGIPLGRMNQDEMELVRVLEHRLEERVIGQSHAMLEIAETVRRSRAGLTDPVKPVGVFLLLGTSGVGKTETAIALADLLYGGPSQLTVINMSEFKEDSKVSQLVGSSAGYVGYGEGGVLTEAVRRKPHSVLLLDEIEKANRAVQDIFLSAFDKGLLRDGEGRDIDFRNTLIVMTSNAGSSLIAELCATEPGRRPKPADLLTEIQPMLLEHFRPEFVGRSTPIVYYPLTPDDLAKVVKLQLERVAKRIHTTYEAAVHWDDGLIKFIVGQCTDRSAGARVIDRVLNQQLLPKLSSRLLARVAAGQPVRSLRVNAEENGIEAVVE